MPRLAYFTILAVLLVVVAVILFLTVSPLAGIFTAILAHFSLKLEELNE